MLDAGEWHAVWAGESYDHAFNAHRAANGALGVIDHPHTQEVKIIPAGADYSHAPLADPLAEPEIESAESSALVGADAKRGHE
jgi:hypothetical protein